VEVEGQHHVQSNNRSRFSYNAYGTGAGGDFVSAKRWPHQHHHHHHHHHHQTQQQPRLQLAPYSGSSSAIRPHDPAAASAGTIPTVNGVSSAAWRQQRGASGGNVVHAVNLPYDHRNFSVS